ncbi:protein maelstrom homolog [Nomia melanderi]|uniref:protein maelstrom homolog n=1 Tax=Nomia melanderi TaxID=2448451 RepID=UPI0013042EDB|nr:protein maelstrom homolog [Nomia melanderi]XP_031834007.1 protein maelstrom homolog [Nomia melanderi]XP_031834008.1 protein maelstrom homolog [Nomia melanderi]
MPKNNKGMNAFFCFMVDWKLEQEKRGKKFPHGLKDVQRDPQLNEDWASLSHEQKAYYKSKAKDSKIQAQGSLSKKTTLGENIDEILLAEKNEQEFQENMLQYIDSVISMGTQHNSLEKLKFILIHVNWFYRKEIGINKFDFGPAEFAVGEFSLGHGVENMYHEIINIKIPLGWKGDALKISHETHKITIEHPDGQSDFAYMYDNFVKLLRSNMTGDKYPPLFTIKDMAPAVESLLNRMCNASRKSTDDFVIYSLEALFAGLRNAAAQNEDSCSIPLVVAEHEFKKELFAFVGGLECEFHKSTDAAVYCSMSKVKQWCFTICDYCCEHLHIPMIEGIHCPLIRPNFEVTNNTIDFHMCNLTLNDESSFVSMTGVSEDHRQKVSERTCKDEQRRRNQSKTLEIIDHSKHNSIGNLSLPGRPLRPPKTMARAMSESDNNNDIFNKADFPPIGGRGIMMNKKVATNKNFPPFGKGSGKST